MVKSFKKVIACLLAVLMVAFSMPFTALAANPVDYRPDLNVRFGCLTNDYYDYGMDLSSGAWGDAADKYNNGTCGIYTPVLDYTGGVNPTTGALEITKLSCDVTKAGPNIFLYNEEIEDLSEFDETYENAKQFDYEEGMGFTMTIGVKDITYLTGLVGWLTYSDNVEPAYIWNSGTTNKNTKTKIGTKAQCDADTTSKKKVLSEGFVKDQDSTYCYTDMTTAEDTVFKDNYIFLNCVSETGYDIDISAVDTTADDAIVNPTTGELGYDCAGDAILITLQFIIVDEISEANPLVIGIGPNGGDWTHFDAITCAATGDDLMDIDHSNYGKYTLAPDDHPLNYRCFFQGYNANTGETKGGSTPSDPCANGHTYGDPEYTNPTCTENGYNTYTCSVCGHEETEYDDPSTAGHTWAEDEEIPATCTSTGTAAGKTCTVCGATEGYDELPMADHTWAEDEEIPATCTSTGTAAGRTCSACGATEGYGELPMADHTWAEDEEVPSTCVTPGTAAGKTCSVCGATEGYGEIAVIDHDYQISADVPSTETEQGYTEYTCTMCGDSYKNWKPLADHVHVWVEDEEVPATCTTPGTAAGRTCSACGEKEGYAELPVIDHIWAEDAEIPATCTSTGTAAGKTCTVCGATEGYDELPMADHTWAEDAEIPATCTTPGTAAGKTCSVCGAKEGYGELAIVDHTWREDAEVAPTFTAPGVKAGKTCTVCGATEGYGEIAQLEGVDVTITDTYASFGDVDGLAVGTTTVEKGTTIALSATPVDGCEFVGWQVEKTLVSTDANYSFVAYQDVTVTPVFVDAAAGETITVVFYDCYMNVTKSYVDVPVADFQAEMAAAIPEGSQYAGKEFKGWNLSDAEIKALDHSATIVGQYDDRANDGYTVTTTGTATFADGTQEMTGVKYDTQVTVTAPGATAWTIDGATVAYGESYTFYVGSNVEVAPVFDTVTATPTVAMVDVSQVPGSHKVAFLATMQNADGYKIIDHGFVYGKNATAAELVLENVGNTIAASGTVVKSASITSNATEQFALNYGLTSKNGRVTAVAYVTYQKGDTIATVYSALGEYTYA